MKRSVKQERIDIRVTPEEKSLFVQAHQISGEKSFSSFLIRIIRKKSHKIIEDNQRVLASERDRNIFFDAICADQAPNQALSEAARRFKALQDT